jgi:hypothetical protein
MNAKLKRAAIEAIVTVMQTACPLITAKSGIQPDKTPGLARRYAVWPDSNLRRRERHWAIQSQRNLL